VQHYADAVRELLAYADSCVSEPAPPPSVIKPWIYESIIEGIVDALYPAPKEWSDEVKARHRSHLKLALMLNHEALNEDVRRLLERVKE
jgi:hypothetical protein